MKEYKLPPVAKDLISSMRSIGYNFETAIADLIDNSISAFSKNIDVYLEFDPEPVIYVLDDGCGMTANELLNAMRYGSINPNAVRSKKDLGRFGLGLKSASLSICKNLTVVSKKTMKSLGARWDLDHVEKTNGWNLLIFEPKDISSLGVEKRLSSYSSGTILVLRDFDRLKENTDDINRFIQEKVHTLFEHFSLIYHRFISDKIVFRINNQVLKAFDPFLVDHDFTKEFKPEKFPLGNGIVTVQPWILPKLSKLSTIHKDLAGGVNSLKQKQGFYIYRNKRLIIWGSWFKIKVKDELSKLARIQVDIDNDLDHLWNIDVKKSNAVIPDKLRLSLMGVVDRSIGLSKRTQTFIGKRKTIIEDIELTWARTILENKAIYSLNKDSSVYKILRGTMDSNQVKLFDSFVNMIETNYPYQEIYNDNSMGMIDDPHDNLEIELLVEQAMDIIKLYENLIVDRYERKREIKKILSMDQYNKEEVVYILKQKKGEYYD